MSTPAPPPEHPFPDDRPASPGPRGVQRAEQAATPNLDRLAESVGFTCCQTDEFKYVRWLTYTQPGEYREELYRLTDDPDEVNNRVHDATLAATLKRLRDYRDFVVDHTPTAQTRWAPLMDGEPDA